MIKNLLHKIIYKGREWQLERNRKRLKNHDFTIVSNNCVGGIIYHDLGEQFRSPTINLWLTPTDFVVFAQHLEYYLSLPIEKTSSKESYPVGVINGKYGVIHIYFQHYNTFDEAVVKWKERTKRINWESIYLICEAPFENDQTIEELMKLPYKKRIIIHTHINRSSRELVKMPYKFYTINYEPGKIIKFPKRGIKRYLEKIDYVRFLNE